MGLNGFSEEQKTMKDSEAIIQEELEILEKILSKYMSKDDSMRVTFHLLNIMRELNIK